VNNAFFYCNDFNSTFFAIFSVYGIISITAAILSFLSALADKGLGYLFRDILLPSTLAIQVSNEENWQF